MRKTYLINADRQSCILYSGCYLKADGRKKLKELHPVRRNIHGFPRDIVDDYPSEMSQITHQLTKESAFAGNGLGRGVLIKGVVRGG